MIVHTNEFKDEIKKFARQITGRIYQYNNYNLVTEASDTILTENNLNLMSEQPNLSDKTLIDSEDIISIDIIKNGQLLQSLMKQCNFTCKVDMKVGTYINAQLGLLVNNSYEYLDYGDYIIYSKEYNADDKTYSYVCYDKMLYSMVKYKPLNISYPITVRNYINAICNEIGLTFANASDTFTNYNQNITTDMYADKEITYRDILDDLSEIVAGNICINNNGELEIKYPTNSNDTINEEYLKDINVTFNEKFGPINKVIIRDTDVDIDYIAKDDSSIEENGATSVIIADNLLIQNANQETIAQNILTQLNGLSYYLNDFSTTGVCYYDFLDLFNVNIDSVIYPCLLLNNEINITTGINETIFTDRKEDTETETYKYETSTLNSKSVTFKINQQEGKIESKVEKDGVISAINQSAEQISIDANKISLAGKNINLTSDNITINSTNFIVDENGDITAHSAKLEDILIKGGEIYIPIILEYDYTQADADRATNIYLGLITPTQEDYDKLDINKDGAINLLDVTLITRLVIDNIGHSTPAKIIFKADGINSKISLINGNNVDIVSLSFNGVMVRDQNNNYTNIGPGRIVLHDSNNNTKTITPTS